MHAVTSAHAPGTIIVPTSDLSRYTGFWTALLGLQVPAGSTLATCAGVGIAENLNRCLEHLQGAWVWVLNDDHDFAPTLLLDLLDRNVDVIAPLTTRRSPPFQPVVFGAYDPQTNMWPTLAWADLPSDPDALYQVGACGGAGLLIRRHVLDRLTKPIFEIGRTRSDGLSEDLWLCKKVHDAGFKVYVDCKHRLGHTHPVTYWPNFVHNRWCVGADLGNGISIDLLPRDVG